MSSERFEDLTGQTIGDVEVLEYIGLDKFNRRSYKVKCVNCGEIAIKDASYIRKYKKINCACNNANRIEYKLAKRNEEVGKVYGKLRVIKYDGERDTGTPLYTCICEDCKKILPGMNIYQVKKLGRSRLCDCKYEVHNFKDLTGQTFGNIKVLELLGSKDNRKLYKIQCTKCGAIAEKTSDIVRRGKFNCNCKNVKLEKNREEYIGRRVGDFTVNEFLYIKNGRNHYLCTCDNGHTEIIRQDVIDQGKKKCLRCANSGSMRGWMNSYGIAGKSREEINKEIEDQYKNKIYGDLQILSLDRNEGNGKIYFKCRCNKCGDIITMRIDSIKKYGSTNQCSCNEYDLTGKIFKDLKVLGFSRYMDYTDDNGKVIGRKKYYTCMCQKCNTIVECRSDEIKKYGHSGKCNCEKTKSSKTKPDEERIKEDLTGETFGAVTVVKLSHIDNNGHSMWVYKCNKCGNTGVTSRSNLLSGNTTQCPSCARKLVGLKLRDDLTGKVFGKLHVIGLDENATEKSNRNDIFWKCYCENCGQTKIFSSHNLKHRSNPTCGCISNSQTHGMSNTKIYGIWADMKNRCNERVNLYGFNSIEYDPEWEKFENFYKDMGPSYREGLTLERINNNGIYCKDNCKWADRNVQMNNTSRSNLYYYFGEWLTLGEIYHKYADEGVQFIDFKEKFMKGDSLTKALRNEELRARNSTVPVEFQTRTGEIIDQFTNYKF